MEYHIMFWWSSLWKHNLWQRKINLLLDWRQDFGGKIEYGDIYYDLAKLYEWSTSPTIIDGNIL